MAWFKETLRVFYPAFYRTFFPYPLILILVIIGILFLVAILGYFYHLKKKDGSYQKELFKDKKYLFLLVLNIVVFVAGIVTFKWL
ncbi:protein of unknown function [Ruminococcaceae bacterium BL-6]|nr:protein of unknown function [Ruminococcaceae bacterium BL-6]